MSCSRTTDPGIDKATLAPLPDPQANVVPKPYTESFKVRPLSLTPRVHTPEYVIVRFWLHCFGALQDKQVSKFVECVPHR